ncbi:MAG: OmpA family protein [Gammaproteobacteria bacterium]|nr:hypothetical protein [Chromatiales bacterium]MDP6675625.1 OmpA family protein [Gammaproteobacteria bacterium]
MENRLSATARKLRVTGCRDKQKQITFNQELSARSAGRVAAYLGTRQVMSKRMIIIGAAGTRPVASNDTQAGQAQNHRVELTIVPVTT